MEVISSDVGQVLVFTVTQDGAVLDLTGATITLVLSNGREYLCASTAPATGIATKTTQAGDFPSVGKFQAVLRVEQGGNTLYSKPFQFDVKSIF